MDRIWTLEPNIPGIQSLLYQSLLCGLGKAFLQPSVLSYEKWILSLTSHGKGVLLIEYSFLLFPNLYVEMLSPTMMVIRSMVFGRG